MREVLQDLADRTPLEHPYLGDNEVLRLRQQLDRLGPSAPVFSRVVAHSELAQEELNIDNIEAAIEHLTIANELFPRAFRPQ